MVGLTYSQSVYKEFEKTHDSDLFEKVIDDLMIERYSEDKETTEYINSLSGKDKRIAILSLLDSDNYKWDSLRIKIEGNKVSKYTHLTEILEDLRVFAKLGKVNKKEQGEVMSPIKELAKPMVKLVEEYEHPFWTDPDNKVLDGSAGIGTFLILSLIKFMNGLKYWEPDPEKRYKHIVENCLYYGELQSRNVFLWLCLIDPYNEYKTNTYWGSFLDSDKKTPFNDHMKLVWGVDGFDLIIQNSPYQILKDGNTKSQSIWQLFVEKSISLLRKDRYMVMVHPDSWRSGGKGFNGVGDLLRSKDILYLKVHDRSMGVQMFGVQTTFDYYILRNSSTNVKTDVHFLDGTIQKINLKKHSFIPNGKFDLFNSIIAKEGEAKVELLYSSSLYEIRNDYMSTDETDIFKFPCVYTILKDGTINLHYSNERKGHFGISKVIWSNGTSMPIVDIDGSYGLTQFSYAIIDDIENLENIKNAMLSEDFIELMSYSQGIKHRYNRNVISTFRKDFWKEFI